MMWLYALYQTKGKCVYVYGTIKDNYHLGCEINEDPNMVIQ